MAFGSSTRRLRMRSPFIKSAATIFAATALVVAGFASAAYPHGYGDGQSHHRHHHQDEGDDGDGGSSAPVVLTNGLNNPRQLSLVDGRVLLIAEAGSGGPTCQGTGEDEMCLGSTGAVSSVPFPQDGTNRGH